MVGPFMFPDGCRCVFVCKNKLPLVVCVCYSLRILRSKKGKKENLSHKTRVFIVFFFGIFIHKTTQQHSVRGTVYAL